MDNNYYTSPDLLNAINNANYLYTKMTNTSPQEVKKTINDNDEIGEASPKDEDFDQHFNPNGVFVIDSPEKQLGSGTRADSYFASHDIKHAFIYKMKDVFNGGYVFFYNTNELSRKFPQPDITDFTYLGKMIEIALKSR